MNDRIYTLRGIDPLLFRDGRPFNGELGAANATTLPLPHPGTVAGFARTQLGNRAGWNWRENGPQRALAVPVHGPLLLRDNGEIEIVWRAPADAVIYPIERENPDGEKRVMRLRPGALGSGEGCDLPAAGMTPLEVTQDVKPVHGYRYWPNGFMEQWLQDSFANDPLAPEDPGEPSQEERAHTAVDPKSGCADEGRLFTTRMFCFGQPPYAKGRRAEWMLAARVRTEENTDITGPGQFGGEQRVGVIEAAGKELWPTCPAAIRSAVDTSTRARMILATPAIFSCGWKPGWLDDSLEGSPPGCSSVRLKLVSAAVPRREPVSGWDYARGSRGMAKPVRWMAPAGSVYFFDVVGGDAGELAMRCWLEPVSDNEQDGRDGYGLALWGVWQPTEKEEI